jgi:hypothetical protein
MLGLPMAASCDTTTVHAGLSAGLNHGAVTVERATSMPFGPLLLAVMLQYALSGCAKNLTHCEAVRGGTESRPTMAFPSCHVMKTQSYWRLLVKRSDGSPAFEGAVLELHAAMRTSPMIAKNFISLLPLSESAYMQHTMFVTTSDTKSKASFVKATTMPVTSNLVPHSWAGEPKR